MTYDTVRPEGGNIDKNSTRTKTQPIMVPVAAASSGGYAMPRTADKAPKEDADTLSADKKTNKEEEDGTKSKEVGGPKGPEPTRFGDWEQKGKCIDF